MMMRQWPGLALAALVMAGMLGAPVVAAVAQDGLAPVNGVIDPAAGALTARDLVFVAVILGLLAVIVLVLRPLIIQLGVSSPSWAVEAAFRGAESLMQSGLKYAGQTPNKLDDELLNELAKELQALRKEIYGMQAAAFGARRDVTAPPGLGSAEGQD